MPMDIMQEYENEQNKRSRLENELAPGEMILWQGSPAPGTKLSGQMFGRIFGVVWLLFALYWESTAIFATFSMRHMGIVGFIFPLFGLPFVVLGIYIVFVQPGKQQKKIKNSLYAITGQRLLILDAVNGNLRSLPLSAIRSWNRQMRQNGYGDLIFDTGEVHVSYRNAAYGGNSANIQLFTFYNIDVQSAEKALQQANGTA